MVLINCDAMLPSLLSKACCVISRLTASSTSYSISLARRIHWFIFINSGTAARHDSTLTSCSNSTLHTPHCRRLIISGKSESRWTAFIPSLASCITTCQASLLVAASTARETSTAWESCRSLNSTRRQSDFAMAEASVTEDLANLRHNLAKRTRLRLLEVIVAWSARFFFPCFVACSSSFSSRIFPLRSRSCRTMSQSAYLARR